MRVGSKRRAEHQLGDFLGGQCLGAGAPTEVHDHKFKCELLAPTSILCSRFLCPVPAVGWGSWSQGQREEPGRGGFIEGVFLMWTRPSRVGREEGGGFEPETRRPGRFSCGFQPALHFLTDVFSSGLPAEVCSPSFPCLVTMSLARIGFFFVHSCFLRGIASFYLLLFFFCSW